jgi:Ni/Fe-hydrogenase subunit HybB-like protein
MNAIIKSYRNIVGFSLLSLGMLIGLISIGYVLKVGHSHAYNLTRQIPWGILISTYVFFAVSCSGLCLVSSLGHVFGIKEFEVIGKRAILAAILTLLTGFGVIAMELDHPFRMAIWVIFSPNPSSAIWWMGTLYGFYLVLLCIELYAFIKEKHKLASMIGLVGFVIAISACSNLGAVFGLLEARPFWHGSYLPIYFILSALVSGCALLALLVFFNHSLRGLEIPSQYKNFMITLGKLQALLLGILIFFVIWKTIPGIYERYPGIYEATIATITGKLSLNFWFFEVFLGLAVPFIILLNRATRTPFGVMLAGLFTTIGLFFMRYDMVVAGQIHPMRNSYGAGSTVLLHYTPSLAEMGIVIGSVSVCLFVYILIEKKFDLSSTGHQ